jgi:cyclophilin family peptidyl-prolyl cis-trans isomerase
MMHGRAALTVALTAAALGFVTPVFAGPLIAFDTTMGRIVVELDLEKAPVSSRNFMRYVSEGHYDGTLFHRVVEGFVIQGGGLTVDMQDKPTHAPIVNEANNGLTNATGTLAMARETAIDSATSQFFINVVDNPRLDHVDVPPEGITVNRRGRDVFIPQSQSATVYGYAVFGRVVEGMDVVERIRHVPVRTVVRGDDTFENVPAEPVIIRKAAPLSPAQ